MDYLSGLKTNSKTINLTNIANSIERLTNRYGMNYTEITSSAYKASPTKYKIPADTGMLETQGLLKHKEVAVAITTAEANTKMEPHIHEEVEIIKVLNGEIHISIDNELTRVLKENEMIILQPYIAHGAFWPVETTFIAITLPACNTWPEVK